MKIMFATNGMPMGGIEKNIIRLTREYSMRGHSVVVVSGGGVLESEVSVSGGKHMFVETAPRFWHRSIGKMSDVVCEACPDIIHVFSASAAVLLWLTFKIYCRGGSPRKPVVVSSIMGIQSSQDESFFTSIFRLFLTTLGAQKILIISPEIEKYVNKLFFLRSRMLKKDVVGVEMPNFLDNEELGDIRRGLGIKENEKIVTTIGRLNSTKSHELFIRAAAKVLERRTDVHFYIIGDGETRKSLKHEIDQLGLTSNVHLLGMRKDIYRLLSASDVYVRPGIVEGFVGITVLEAQSLKVPVISFDTNDVRVAISDGVTGMLVPVSDTSEMAKKIIYLIEHKEIADVIAGNGYECVKSIFSISSIAAGLLSLYDELLIGT